MHLFESILALLLGATALSALAKRFNIAYPALIALAGALLAFIPGAPRLDVPPDLILALFVAPVLLDAAYDTSLRDLRRNWLPVTSLALVAVMVTTTVVAVAARALMPELPWAAALALGALLAPPDAVSALAVLKHAQPPHRIRVILEGESLLNDATALLIYRLAVGAIGAGSIRFSDAAPTIVLVFFGSVIIGWLLSKPVLFITSRIDDAPSSVIFQFVTTFGVWLAAERLGLSGVVTIVVFGLAMARRTATPMPAHLRLPSFAMWEAVTVVLNVMAFALIGLQLAPILESLTNAQEAHYLELALVLLGVVIAIRFAWVFAHQALVTLWQRRVQKQPGHPGSRSRRMREALLISWSGMRGIVTLAAAMALPLDFPERDFILFTAFVVVLGTLLIQGLTLRPLLSLLKFPPDTVIDTEIQVAREAGLKAIMETLVDDDTPTARGLKQEYAEALHLAKKGDNPRDTTKNELRLRLINVARKAIEDLRSAGTIGDTAYRHVEAELDQVDLSARSTTE